MGRIIRNILLFLQIALFSVLLVSCNTKKEEELPWTKSVSYFVTEDGWVYTCEYFMMKDGSVSEVIHPVTFNAINLRYLKDNSIRILGNGITPESDRDMRKISAFLGYGSETDFLTAEEIAQKDRSELELEEIDEQMFFELLDEALSGEPYVVGEYMSHPSYAMLNEPGFLDGYQFQIGFRQGMGNIGVIMIDVLFSDENAENGYRQLSDMVEDNTASSEQILLYEQLKEIEKGIVENNLFCYGESEMKELEFAKVDLSRLYQFLSDIHNNSVGKYDASSRNN